MFQHSRLGESFIWRNIDLLEGSMAEFVPENTEPHATQKDTGRGKLIRVVTESGSGTLSMPCDTSTQVYREMEILQESDKVNLNVVGVGLYKNEIQDITVTYKNMSILNIPPRPGGGTEAAQVTLEFGYESKTTIGPAIVPTVGD